MGSTYCTLYPSDYTDEIDSYGSDDQIVGVSVMPPFPIVYFLDETTGGVTVLTKGGAHRVEALFDCFGKSHIWRAGASEGWEEDI